MAVPLTTGKYKPPSSNFAFMPGAGATAPSWLPQSLTGGYQPNKTGQPGPQYGGDYMYPGGGSQGGGKPPPVPTTPTVTAPQAPPTPGYWQTPDYSSMIGGSYEVGAAESAMGSQMAAARAAFQSQLRQSFIDLGYTGDTGKGSQMGDFSKYIDKDTIQKAIDNKYSAYAQIKKQQTAASDVNAALALSQGLTGSGSATAEEESLQSQVEQGRYDSLRNFLSGGQTGLSNLSSMQAQLAAGVAQARAAAAARLAAMYPPTWHDPVQPTPPGTGYGGGYVTPDAQSWLDQPTFYGTSVDEYGKSYKQPLPKWWGQT